MRELGSQKLLMCLKIKNRAVFISDAHESSYSNNFYRFLQRIETNQIEASQLFLMGDMFDLLVGDVKFSCDMYRKHIELINKISLKMEVFYFEGNHDFRLKRLFPHTKVFSFSMQPVRAEFENGSRVHLSHGDKFEGVLYLFYTKIIRSSLVLKFLNILDLSLSGKISKKIQQNQLKKNLCKKIENFEPIIVNKLPNYEPREGEFIIEGHYHQDKKIVKCGITYINLPSFACNQSFFIVECVNNIKFAQNRLRG